MIDGRPWFSFLVVADRMPSQAVARQLSPVHQLRSDGVPSIHFFGSEDGLMKTSVDYLERAEALGIEAELFVANGQRHGFFNSDPWLTETLWWSHVFLNRHGYLTGLPKIRRPGNEAAMERRIPGS